MQYRAYLTSFTAKSDPKRFGPLTAVTSIGRMPACSVVVSGDPSVSKLHAEIRQTPEGDFVLEDRNSSNGTYVAGRKTARHVLRQGDSFMIGARTFHFDLIPQDDLIHSVQIEAFAPAGADTLTLTGAPGQRLPRSLVLERKGTIEIHASETASTPGVFPPASEIVELAELRRDYEKLRIAHSILAAVGRPMPLDETLRIIARRTFDVLPAMRFAALLVADGTGTLSERLVLQRDGKPPAEAVPVSRTLIARVLSAGKPLLARDVGAISSVADAVSIVQAAVRSVVCAPIAEGAELFGLLYADNCDPSPAFDETDLLVLSTIANQLALALRNARLVVEVREEARRRTVLGRFLSPNLVNEVLEGRVSLSRAGEVRAVAVLFTDIRGFVLLAEKLPDGQVTALLNEHFDAMVDVLFRFGGTLDKYIGDSIMAVFGVPKTGATDAETAVRCALEMQTAAGRLNQARLARGDAPVEIGIGVSYGNVSWGPIGSRDTMDYTVVGDVVNVASRLCGDAKAGEVLVTGAVHAQLPASLPAVKLEKSHMKGKSGDVEIWRIARS